MKPEAILLMQPGSELDALILKQVYGLEIEVDEGGYKTIPPFSTSECDALLMAQYLSASDNFGVYSFELKRICATESKWEASFDFGKFKFMSIIGLAHAICIAAALATTEEE